MISYKFYYINLDKSSVRREFMQNQFKKLDIPLTRFKAIYGKKLPSDFLKNAKANFNLLAHYPNLNDGEIGLTKTYFELWKEIEKQNEDYAIILEDDALIDVRLIEDLPNILKEITTNDFVDLSGRKGYFKLVDRALVSLYTIPALQTTAQIIGKSAAHNLRKKLTSYYAPIDVLKQDVYKHQVMVYTTKKNYVKSNDKALGGTTLQKKGLPKTKKVIREIIRPFWQIFTLVTYKLHRVIRNFLFYKSLKRKLP